MSVAWISSVGGYVPECHSGGRRHLLYHMDNGISIEYSRCYVLRRFLKFLHELWIHSGERRTVICTEEQLNRHISKLLNMCFVAMSAKSQFSSTKWGIFAWILGQQTTLWWSLSGGSALYLCVHLVHVLFCLCVWRRCWGFLRTFQISLRIRFSVEVSWHHISHCESRCDPRWCGCQNIWRFSLFCWCVLEHADRCYFLGPLSSPSFFVCLFLRGDPFYNFILTTSSL